MKKMTTTTTMITATTTIATTTPTMTGTGKLDWLDAAESPTNNMYSDWKDWLVIGQ